MPSQLRGEAGNNIHRFRRKNTLIIFTCVSYLLLRPLLYLINLKCHELTRITRIRSTTVKCCFQSLTLEALAKL
jgi:hypothetical protein